MPALSQIIHPFHQGTYPQVIVAWAAYLSIACDREHDQLHTLSKHDPYMPPTSYAVERVDSYATRTLEKYMPLLSTDERRLATSTGYTVFHRYGGMVSWEQFRELPIIGELMD